MVVSEELVNKIRQIFGLNLYEARIWLALLAKGVATAGELSDLANVPRSRTYDVLESLEKKGFVIMKVGKPIKYIAVPPSQVIEKIKKQILEEAKKKAEFFEQLKESELIKELEDLYRRGVQMIQPHELTSALKGRHNLYSHLETMLRSAEESVYIMTTETGFIRKVDAFKPIFEELKNRGVRIRIITPVKPENARYVKDLLNVAEIRDSEDLRGRVIVVDGKEVLLILTDDKKVHPTFDLGIWVNSEFLAGAIQSLMDKVWDKLKPAEEKLKELGL